MTDQVEQATQMRTAGLAGYWLHQSEMWLSGLSSYGVPAEAINDLRQNARAAVHEAIEATERAALTVTPQEAAKVQGMLERIVSASDYYGKEPTGHDALTLAYAHQSTRNLAIAALDALRAISEDSQ